MTRLQPRCRRTGKRRYRDLIAANLALATIQARDSSRRPKTEQRTYACRACGGAHLTSQPKAFAPRVLRSSTPKPRPARKRTGPTPDVVALVRERDGHRCVCCGKSRDLTTHHRSNRGMGGVSAAKWNRPANLLTACSDCNTRMESDADYARLAAMRGWKVSRYFDPAQVVVHYLDGPWLLTDDGSRRPHRHQESA